MKNTWKLIIAMQNSQSIWNPLIKMENFLVLSKDSGKQRKHCKTTANTSFHDKDIYVLIVTIFIWTIDLRLEFGKDIFSDVCFKAQVFFINFYV